MEHGISQSWANSICTALHENVAYFIDGSGASGSQRDAVYNSVSNVWTHFDMPNGVEKCETHVVGGAIYVFGFACNASDLPNQYIKIDISAVNTFSGPHCPFCLTDPRPDSEKRFFQVSMVSRSEKKFIAKRRQKFILWEVNLLRLRNPVSTCSTLSRVCGRTFLLPSHAFKGSSSG